MSPRGDAFTSPGGAPGASSAVGASEWFYANVRSNAVIGISDTAPRSGTGSVSFNAPTGAKADIEYYGVLGSLADLSDASYDWLRNSGSTAPTHLHPSLRILVDRDGDLLTSNDRGGLVFERAYNPLGPLVPVPVDGWTTDTIAADTKLWNFGLGLGNEYDIDGDTSPYETLAEWQAFMPNATIIGFSSGVGSGWSGTFVGAVDNIGWTIGGQATSTNFEVQAAVPEPASLALLGFGLLGLAGLRRRA